MKVSELIKKLSQFPLSQEVYIENCSCKTKEFRKLKLIKSDIIIDSDLPEVFTAAVIY